VVQGLSINELVKVQAQIKTLSKKPKRWGASNKEVYEEALHLSEIPTKEEEVTRVDEVIREAWKVDLVNKVVGVTEVPSEVLEEDHRNDGFKRPKLVKKKPTQVSRARVEKRVVRIDGKDTEVDVRVLPPGNEYYVGKTPPSGRPPGGTSSTEDPDDKQTRRTAAYVARRVEVAKESEASGQHRKGGDSVDYQEALDKLQEEAAAKGIKLDTI